MNVEEDDLIFLKVSAQPLWTGCRNTPYLIRAGINIDKCLIYKVITNLRQSWICKLNKDRIEKDKELYNKSIQTTNFQGVLDLLDLALKFDPQAEYSFKLNDSSLYYGYSNVIKIYTLTWVFDCKVVDDQHHNKILINDILNPLLLTIHSLENRCNNYKTAFSQLEQDYIKRLNEKERAQYKVRDKDEDLSVYILDDQIDQEKICQINFTPMANYFIQYYAINKVNKTLQQSKKRQPQQQNKNDNPSQNINKKGTKFGRVMKIHYLICLKEKDNKYWKMITMNKTGFL
ncbi:unnamed protein product (macronuclear) [Paramecium tetraurelia]|uniref:Non-homologous end-joining factor 1 n=1 Tax=Paramecium tetraurelia TaxID=5888 RepID=A0CND2_PARTE|nr:uncharacterized protein GSPATT00008741001 [Paramecium tetraurelia]CAK72299.1 unnamed protein product [Paramecium tetraurelia]|eukprot:XP_001439696.1 hypothetical protein (macronuclear) [Paramecium tetraurelia strain d4-2]